MNNNCIMDWPCDYCKKKFIDVRLVIDHELYLCDKNPKFKYDSKKIETKYKTKYKIQTSPALLKT